MLETDYGGGPTQGNEDDGIAMTTRAMVVGRTDISAAKKDRRVYSLTADDRKQRPKKETSVRDGTREV